MTEPSLALIDWRPSYRIIPSRYPPIPLFENVTEPADLDAVLALESLTNSRLRDEVGELERVPPEDRISGPGTSYIMAAFTHVSPDGSRFSDGTYGVYYAAKTQQTAIRETVYHRQRFMAATQQRPQLLEMRVLRSRLSETLHDLRPAGWEAIHHPIDYAASRCLGAKLRASGSNGLVYRSVRDFGGECAAIFRPRVLSPVTLGSPLGYRWNGERITDCIELGRHTTLESL